MLDIAAQDVLESVELQRASDDRMSMVGQSRVDLSALFGREEALAKRLDDAIKLRQKSDNVVSQLEATRNLENARTRRSRQISVVSLALLLGLVISLLFTDAKALASLISGASVIGLVLGAIIAVPLTIWLAPRNNIKDTQDR